MMSNLERMLNTWDEADSELNKKIDNTNLSSIVASATASAVNSKTVEINGTGKNIEKLVVEGKTVQDGIPTPSAPVEVKGVGDYDEETGKYKIPISCGDTTKNVYLDEPLLDGEKADVVSGVAEKKYEIKKIKDISWLYNSTYKFFQFVVLNVTFGTNAVLCDSLMFGGAKSDAAMNTADRGIYTNGIDTVKIKDVAHTTIESFIEAYGDSNIVYPVKSTKETFDGVEIPTSVGKNTLSIDTEVTPAKVEATTFGDYYSKSQIDKMFADVQADLAAMAELL